MHMATTAGNNDNDYAVDDLDQLLDRVSNTFTRQHVRYVHIPID